MCDLHKKGSRRGYFDNFFYEVNEYEETGLNTMESVSKHPRVVVYKGENFPPFYSLNVPERSRIFKTGSIFTDVRRLSTVPVAVSASKDRDSGDKTLMSVFSNSFIVRLERNIFSNKKKTSRCIKKYFEFSIPRSKET